MFFSSTQHIFKPVAKASYHDNTDITISACSRNCCLILVELYNLCVFLKQQHNIHSQIEDSGVAISEQSDLVGNSQPNLSNQCESDPVIQGSS